MTDLHNSTGITMLGKGDYAVTYSLERVMRGVPSITPLAGTDRLFVRGGIHYPEGSSQIARYEIMQQGATIAEVTLQYARGRSAHTLGISYNGVPHAEQAAQHVHEDMIRLLGLVPSIPETERHPDYRT